MATRLVRNRVLGLAIFVAVSVLLVPPARAGSFAIVVCDAIFGCVLDLTRAAKLEAQCAQPPWPESCQRIRPLGIVHPLGYTDQTRNLELRICIQTEDVDDLEVPTKRAISMWNELIATTENCEGCLLWEDSSTPEGMHHAQSVLVHELGHCAFGLAHIERFWGSSTTPPGSEDGVDCIAEGLNCHSQTSFTRSADADEILQHNAIRGDSDDTQSGIGTGGANPEAVAYYLKGINDPVTLGEGVIDSSTYIRSVSPGNLPAGHMWPASANVSVANALGFANTQSVMYGRIPALARYSGLTQDDVNMRRLAMVGHDRTFGTQDDYTVVLTYVGDCSNPHEIEAGLDGSFFPGPPSMQPGLCRNVTVDVTPTTPPQNPISAITYSVVKGNSAEPLRVHLNPALSWDFDEGPDMVVTKEDGVDSVDPGELVTYTISVANNGRRDATGVVLNEVVPIGSTFSATGSLPEVWSCADEAPGGSTCELQIGPVGQGSPPADFSFAVVVDQPATAAELVNLVTVSDDGTNGLEEDPTDNSFTLITPVDVPCNGAIDLVLTAPSVENTVVHEACNSIVASYTVTTGRSVTFKVRNVIGLTNFIVEAGATFKASIDPLAGQEP